MSAVRVALLNDYEIVLRGLEALLEKYTDSVEVVAAVVGDEATSHADVILYDTFGHRADGPKLREVVEANAAKVVVYTWDTHPAESFYADGAAACVHKGTPGESLVEVILAVHEGRPVPTADTEAGEPGNGTVFGQEYGLSQREAEVLAFIAQGLSNQEIADHAFLSINTVKTYIRTAYQKIGVTRRAQAVLWALEHDLAPAAEPQQSS
jgi:two-component system, NarL family, response regulator LiaR